jgi:hypothetical protein
VVVICEGAASQETDVVCSVDSSECVAHSCVLYVECRLVCVLYVDVVWLSADKSVVW